MVGKSHIFHSVFVIATTCSAAWIVAGCSTNGAMPVQAKGNRMIVDRLDRAEDYFDMHPDFEEAFTFLRRDGLADLSPGRHPIDGDRLFCIVTEAPGRTREEAKLEAHHNYIDIQYVIAGVEEMA